ncbi:invasion associated locus B family protein [Bradyrhizobium jicamae]|uniref:invasion associated locus B family protein n=1 Tax=Bradyrhizobium jicamae TaxID=280332 RepID=UPI001BA6EE59|nr:invasion associated locus B family protein [Bradyrhizobium jicamae]MBR0938997.1 invasion associated locus B family protein [Bradyrhizobium jicamae]
MRRLSCVALASWLCGATTIVAQQAPPLAYIVKPSDVAIPEGETLGRFRRTIQPFRNWTLICDESLNARRRVCNITQAIINPQGAVAFSWSLVATDDGKPLMMMRVPAAAGSGQPIELTMGEKPDRIIARTDRCNASFCFATIAIGDVLKRHIRAATTCVVTYQLPQIGPVVLNAPLDGLVAALSKTSDQRHE